MRPWQSLMLVSALSKAVRQKRSYSSIALTSTYRDFVQASAATVHSGASPVKGCGKLRRGAASLQGRHGTPCAFELRQTIPELKVRSSKGRKGRAH